MDEKLKEFVDTQWFGGNAKLVVPLKRGKEAISIFDFAQAVAAFTEEKVLEEIRELADKYYNDEGAGPRMLELIDQRLAELKGEKDG